MTETPLLNQPIRIRELFLLSNLFSLFRLAVIPVLWHFLSKPDQTSSYIALFILILAGVTDWLDGYLARKLNQISKMGMVLDPLADKILAGALVIMLIFTRQFPIWLAALIVGRDLLILGASSALLRGKNLIVPSNITGKYAFFFIMVLLACSVIKFEFGFYLSTYIAVALILLSMIMYAKVFGKVKKEEPLAPFRDKPGYRIVRVGLTASVLIVMLIKLYLSWE
jgi:CDP-diacylglycerol--glycerol-3-phosphate 3-phosphatidyltransferase